MYIGKRSYLSIVRSPAKSIVLFLLIFLLTALMSGAISVQHAIKVINENILLKFPSVATLSWNAPNADEWEYPTLELIETVGNLPTVKDFDFSINASLMSQDLKRVTPRLFPGLVPDSINKENVEHIVFSMREMGVSHLDTFEVRGIHNPNPIDVQGELITLTSGRFMSQEELDSGASVAVVSELFAEANKLTVGSKIRLENRVPDYEKMMEESIYSYPAYWHLDEFTLGSEWIEFEIIGLFSVSREFFHQNNQYTKDEGIRILYDYFNLYTRIYAPGKKTLELATFVKELDPDAVGDWFTSLTPLFLLEDFRDLEDFAEQAETVLPSFWEVRELSFIGFEAIFGSMKMMETIADGILWTTFGATLIIVSLLLILYLRDRKIEIGIYRSLGEKKGKIITQILLETFSISIIAIPLALFSGNILSSILSEQMLHDEMIRQEIEMQKIPLHHRQSGPVNLEHFVTQPLPIEDLLDLYNVSLNTEVIFIFSFGALSTILVSTLIPIIYLLKLNPKVLLISKEI